MANKPEPADVKNIWQNQPVEGTTMSLEEIREKARQLERSLRLLHQWIKWPVLLFLMAFMMRQLFRGGNLIQDIGSVLTIIALCYGAYQFLLIRKRPRDAVNGGIEASPSAAFYRAELERQRDFHRGLWFWSRFVILAPGPLVFMMGQAMADPQGIHRIQRTAAVFVVALFLAVPFQHWRARQYQREIDALDAAKE